MYKICKGDDIRPQLMDFFDIATQLEGFNIAMNLELLTIMLLNSLPANFMSLKQCGSRKVKEFLSKNERLNAVKATRFDISVLCVIIITIINSGIKHRSVQKFHRTEAEALRVMRSTGQERWYLDSSCTSATTRAHSLTNQRLWQKEGCCWPVTHNREPICCQLQGSLIMVTSLPSTRKGQQCKARMAD
ncbi:hypothetical protein J437_LFUL019392 [Ladona fulva]|uniref:Uncharacterized protein n=1 Tax=Ladona fulva TaxID=123851 RepID=A0A8K0KQI8_LADFU|nr:hypothetical protein J437_LFUL019392 [Ladona fulva]